MTQFAVFRNPDRNVQIPFVVQIQSSRLERTIGRVMMPLVRRTPRSPPDAPLTPYFTQLGVPVYANPLDLATISRSLLKEAVAVLSEPDQDRIVRAIDEMISRA